MPNTSDSSWVSIATSQYNLHPSRISYLDVYDHEADYVHLLKAVQVHECKNSYCLRPKKGSKQLICRFKFPKKIQHQSQIHFVDDKLEYISKRNWPSLNAHNRFVLELWRANMDIQAIVSLNSVLHYIAKCTSKGEIKSKVFEEFIRTTVQRAKQEDSVTKIVQKILIHMCGERDYSAQETFYVLMGWDLYRSSRQFILCNMKKDFWIPIEINQQNNNRQISARKSLFEKYATRSVQFDHLSFKNYFGSTTKYNSVTVLKKVKNIVRIYPEYQSNSQINNDLYFQQQVILHVPWRNIQLLKSDSQTWEQVYQNHIDIFDSIQNDIESTIEQLGSDEEEVISLHIEKLRDWMHVSASGPS